jgi:hypothetical protein
MSHVDDGMLHAYLDGELTPVERTRLEEHLAECAACRARLEEERALVERAGALLALAEPPERAAPPLGQLRQPRLAWRVRIPLAWAATLLLAIGTGWYLRDLRVAPPADKLAVDSAPKDLASAAPLMAPREEDRGRVPAAPQISQARPTAPPSDRRANAVDAFREVQRQDVAATAAGAPAKQDSLTRVALQPTVVTEQHRAELKAPAAAPVPANAVVITGRPEIRSGWVSRDPTTTWPVIQRDAAVPVLGSEPVGIPGAPVLSIRQSPLGDGVVMVEQALDSATVIQLFMQRAGLARELAPLARADSSAAYRGYTDRTAKARGSERLARLVRGLRVEIAGPLSSDSLSKLLDLVK